MGECVAGLVLAMLTGAQALSRVAETLAGDDVEGIFPRPRASAPFHAHRLGRALDALGTLGLERISGAVISQAIPRDALALARRHTDATSLKRYGAYARDDDEGPRGTYGDSREHRPDLKPLRFGLTVTSEGGPVWGHSTDGNQRASPEHRFQITPRRQHWPARGKPLLGAESTVFAGETMAVAVAHRFRFVTVVPQTVRPRQEVVGRPALEERPLVWEQPGRHPGEQAQSRGASVVGPSRWKTATGDAAALPGRWLVVESTPRAKAKASRRAAAQQAGQGLRATRQQQWPRRPLACEAEAQPAAALCLRELRLPRHHLPDTGITAWGPTPRATRGRPPKGVPRPQRQGWRVMWPVQAATDASGRRAPRERRCGLAPKVLEAQPLSETERLRADKGQPAAELRVTWAKNPAAIAPIVLETPTRMAALGGVSRIARRGYRLGERQGRTGLAARGATLPDRPAPSQRPTARTVFHLRRNIAVGTLQWARRSSRQVTTLNAYQLHVSHLLGYDPTIYGIPHRNSG